VKVSSIGKLIANRSLDYHQTVAATPLKKLLHLINYIHGHGYHHACGCIKNFYETAEPLSENTGLYTDIKTWMNAGSGMAHLLTDLICIPMEFDGSNIYVTDLSDDALYMPPGTTQNRMRFDDIIEASFDSQVEKYSDVEYYLTNSLSDQLADITSIYIRDKKRRYLNTDESNVFDPRLFAPGNIIRATDVSAIRTIIENMKAGWEKTHVNQFARYQEDAIISAEITTTPVNIMDTTSVEFDTYGPGYWIHPQTPGTKNFAAIQAKVNIVSTGTTYLKIVAEYDESDEVESSGSDEVTIDFDLPLEEDVNEYKIEIHARSDSGTITLEVNRVIIKSIHDDSGLVGQKTFCTLSKSRIVPTIKNIVGPLTINSQTVDPSFCYLGSQATTSALPAYLYGSNLTIAGSGTDVTPNMPSPFYGPLDGGVKAAYAGKAFKASSSSVYDITTEDFVIEVVCKIPNSATNDNQRILFKSSTRLYQIYTVNSSGSTILRLGINDGSNSASFDSATFATYTVAHTLWVLDRSGSGICYSNGVAGSAVSISSVGSLTNICDFHLLNTDSLNRGFETSVYYVSMWKKASWLDTHLQADLAKERFAKLMSIYPVLALGTALPEVI
jgi:hypothetical protein